MCPTLQPYVSQVRTLDESRLLLSFACDEVSWLGLGSGLGLG